MHFTEDEPETIYGLIPKPPPVVTKQALHVSQFAGSTTFDTTAKRGHATMGELADVIRKDPKDFLRKQSRTRDLDAYVAPAQRTQTLVKPPVPRRSEIKPMALARKRDFVLENCAGAPKTKPLHPEAAEVRYVDKPDFAAVPGYLARVKKEAREEQAYWDGVREAFMPEDRETRCRELSQEERMRILEGLQANLADLKKKYAALSFGQDHMSFRKRKEGMEAQMAQLEADIAQFCRTNIFVTEV